VKTELTNAEVRILCFYKVIGKVDRALGTGLRFCRSLKTIADAAGCTERTVRRANEHFKSLGILTWISGNSRPQANKYRLMLQGTEGYEFLEVTPAMLASVRRQVSFGTDRMVHS